MYIYIYRCIEAMPFVENTAKSKAPSPRPLKECSISVEAVKILWNKNTTSLRIKVWHARVLQRTGYILYLPRVHIIMVILTSSAQADDVATSC